MSILHVVIRNSFQLAINLGGYSATIGRFQLFRKNGSIWKYLDSGFLDFYKVVRKTGLIFSLFILYNKVFGLIADT